MHTIYHTDAFVLKVLPSGEANARVWLLTRDMGLVVASVQGVRKPGAKLSNALIEYSLVRADLVKGREVWRLISLVMERQIVVELRDSTYARAFVRSLSFVDRLVVGEGLPHEDLFAHVETLADYVHDARDISPEIVDTLSLWRIATMLGYIAVEENQEKFVTLSFADAVGQVGDVDIKKMIRSVHEALLTAHL